MQSWSDNDPSWWNDEDVLMAVDLGYDEGGADDTLLVSVQMAVTEQARKLKRHWKSALGPVPFFHSKDLWNFNGGVFTDAGLDRPQREQLLKELRKIIHRHLTLGLTVNVSKKLYDSLTTNEFRSQWGTAYSFAINVLLVTAHLEFNYGKLNALPNPGLPVDVNVLIEDGHKNSAQALAIVQGSKEIPPDTRFVNVLTAGLGSKKDHPILQAADMLAYAEWQEIRERDSVFRSTMFDRDSRYRTARIDCTPEFIQRVASGPQAFLEHKRRHWHDKPHPEKPQTAGV